MLKGALGQRRGRNGLFLGRRLDLMESLEESGT